MHGETIKIIYCTITNKMQHIHNIAIYNLTIELMFMHII